MKFNKSTLAMGAAIAGIMGAGLVSAPAYAHAKKAETGLCKGANGCAGKSACGQLKGKNSCKGQGFAMLSKKTCEKHHHEWMPAPKMKM